MVDNTCDVTWLTTKKFGQFEIKFRAWLYLVSFAAVIRVVTKRSSPLSGEEHTITIQIAFRQPVNHIASNNYSPTYILLILRFLSTARLN